MEKYRDSPKVIQIQPYLDGRKEVGEGILWKDLRKIAEELEEQKEGDFGY